MAIRFESVAVDEFEPMSTEKRIASTASVHVALEEHLKSPQAAFIASLKFPRDWPKSSTATFPREGVGWENADHPIQSGALSCS